MSKHSVAKAVYYVLVFCWLLQVVLQGYTQELILPTIVLMVYGLWLRGRLRKG
ncbi:MAG: hypothetical protein NC388_04630 [Clostridium sp.]|nr:hypothetical protein [Clostridium sp.]